MERRGRRKRRRLKMTMARGRYLMTGSKKSLAAGARLAGFRIGPDGDVELLSESEVNAVINLAIREAMYRAGWARFERTLH
jgi:hypothetical protein